jgi:hypothetical protein
VASALGNVYRFLRAKGDLKEAERTFREALEIHLKKLGESHPDTADAKLSLGGLMVLEKRFEKPSLFSSRRGGSARPSSEPITRAPARQRRITQGPITTARSTSFWSISRKSPSKEFSAPLIRAHSWKTGLSVAR